MPIRSESDITKNYRSSIGKSNNVEHEKLNDFNETLQGVYEDLATKTESVQNHEFAYSF